MARYDKYDPISGGFRALLAADLTPDANGEVGPVGVELNTSGRVAVGGTLGAVRGVMVKNAAREGAARYSTAMVGAPNPAAFIGQKAGDAVDIMTNGEIVDVSDLAFTPGATIYVDNSDGTLTETATDNQQIGFMVDANRLVVRV